MINLILIFISLWGINLSVRYVKPIWVHNIVLMLCLITLFTNLGILLCVILGIFY
jgi:hypothetical protein